MALVPKRHRGQPRGAKVQQIHISTPIVPELQAEAELGTTELEQSGNSRHRCVYFDE